MADPAMLAAMQAQAMAAQQQAAYGPYAGPAMYGPPPGYPQQAMYAPPGMYPQGVQPVAYMMPAQAMQAPGPFPAGQSPDVYGSYGSMPANYGQPGPDGYPPEGYGGGPGMGGPGMGGPGMYDQGQMGGGGGPMGYGDPGCNQCDPSQLGHGSSLPNGLIGDCLGLIAPYPDGGCAAPRWYDFSIDYMMLKRDNTGRSQDFASNGPLGPIVLSTNDLDFGSYKAGFRFSGAFQLAAANSLEFTYFGQNNFTSNAVVRSGNGNLYSTLGDFGVNPVFSNQIFPEFNSADFQRIDYQSTFDSFEVNWRRRWMAPNCRYQGSWTFGVRHFVLDEKFTYNSISTVNTIIDPNVAPFPIPARGTAATNTTNNLTGIQVGTDVWVCLLPGLRVGGEFQAGVYGNHMNINNYFYTNQVAVPPVVEELDANDVSFIGQANLLMTYRFNYQWSGRAGYQFLYVDGVALAPENFNSIPPQINAPRVTRTNDNGNVFYHGFNIGLEYMW